MKHPSLSSYIQSTAIFATLDFCLTLPVSFLIQALNPSTRLQYFVKYGKA